MPVQNSVQNKKDGGEDVHDDNKENEGKQSKNQGEFPYIDKAVRYLEHDGKEQEDNHQQA